MKIKERELTEEDKGKCSFCEKPALKNISTSHARVRVCLTPACIEMGKDSVWERERVHESFPSKVLSA